jgi:hypothetical protein
MKADQLLRRDYQHADMAACHHRGRPVGWRAGLGFNEAGSAWRLHPDQRRRHRGWGTTATAAANTFYILARNATVGGASAGATLGAAVDAITWEFKLATFTIEVAELAPARPASTSFTQRQGNRRRIRPMRPAKIDKRDLQTSPALLRAPPTRAARASPSARSRAASIGLLGAAAVGLSGPSPQVKPFHLR